MKRKLVAALLAILGAVHAQTSRGTVTGTVLDPTGAVIGGAQVRLIGVDTGLRLSTESNDAGVYRFDAVDLGIYDRGHVRARPDVGQARRLMLGGDRLRRHRHH